MNSKFARAQILAEAAALADSSIQFVFEQAAIAYRICECERMEGDPTLAEDLDHLHDEQGFPSPSLMHRYHRAYPAYQYWQENWEKGWPSNKKVLMSHFFALDPLRGASRSYDPELLDQAFGLALSLSAEIEAEGEHRARKIWNKSVLESAVRTISQEYPSLAGEEEGKSNVVQLRPVAERDTGFDDEEGYTPPKRDKPSSPTRMNRFVPESEGDTIPVESKAAIATDLQAIVNEQRAAIAELKGDIDFYRKEVQSKEKTIDSLKQENEELKRIISDNNIQAAS